MAPAADAMREALATVAVGTPAARRGQRHGRTRVRSDAIRDASSARSPAPCAGGERRRHVGGGGRFVLRGRGRKVLTGLVKRIAAGATATAIGTPDDVAGFQASLRG